MTGFYRTPDVPAEILWYFDECVERPRDTHPTVLHPDAVNQMKCACPCHRLPLEPEPGL